MSTYDLANAIQQRLDSLRLGSLSFWGNWFGRPYDNIHRIVGVDASDDATIIYFDHAESLVVEAPQDWSLDDGLLLIQKAVCVRFQWFYYGRAPSREALQFEEYRLTEGGQISFDSNFQPEREPRLDQTAPAVQLHHFGDDLLRQTAS